MPKLRFVGIVTVILGVSVFVLYTRGWLPGLMERFIVIRFSLPIVGNIGRPVPSSDQPVSLVIGKEGGSNLQQYGLKYMFLDNVVFDSVWRWGIRDKQFWIVFHYLADQGVVTLVVPTTSSVGLIESEQPQSLNLDELDERLNSGDLVRLAFLYKYSEPMPADQVREAMIERRVSSGQPEDVTRRTFNSFPGETAYNDLQVRALFGGIGNPSKLTLLGDDLLLPYIRKK